MTLNELFTNIANAIRRKKGTTEKIVPTNFESEIESIETGTDTTDATATASDILKGKTAYVNDEKIEGTIETYDGASDVGSSGSVLKRLLDGTKRAAQLFVNYPNDDLSEILQYSDTKNVTNFTSMYSSCAATTFPLIDTSNGTNFYAMYQMCGNGQTFPLIDTSNGTNFANMYYSCVNTTTFPLIDTSKGTDFSNMYNGCSKATTFPLIDTSNGTNFTSMYSGCENATSLPRLNTDLGTNFSSMYANCYKLKKIDISKFTSNSTSTCHNFWKRCYLVKAVIIRSFGDSYVLNSSAFSSCFILLGEYNVGYNPNTEQGYVYVPRDMISILSQETNWSTMQFRALEDYTLDGTTTGEFDDEKAGL